MMKGKEKLCLRIPSVATRGMYLTNNSIFIYEILLKNVLEEHEIRLASRRYLGVTFRNERTNLKWSTVYQRI